MSTKKPAVTASSAKSAAVVVKPAAPAAAPVAKPVVAKAPAAAAAAVKPVPAPARAPAPKKAVAKPAPKVPEKAKPVAVPKPVAGVKPAAEPVVKPAVPAGEVAPLPAKSHKKEPAGKKPRLVRDSFTLPESDYAVFKTLKARCLGAGVEIKKSEILRVALGVLNTMNTDTLLDAVNQLERLKTGRPAK